MASSNLFTPAFGGLPQVFFGRKGELGFAQAALDNENSPHKAFFITGNRGCGKTTLLEKISQLAVERGWKAIDVHSAHATQAIIEALAGGTAKTIEKSAKPSMLGVSVGGVSSSSTTEYSGASLGRLLVERCTSLSIHKGVIITVDEIQKVPEGDAENLCSSVQLALRKGLPVMLVLAGLPGSKEKVASYPGCTFMQRAFDMRIGCMQVDETIEAFESVFRRMPQYRASGDAIWEMGLFSQGHPYLMQLVGYYAAERASEFAVGGFSEIGVDLVRSVEPIALEAYRENVLAPILSPLSASLAGYLRAMCEVEDAHGRVGSGAVAQWLGKRHAQVSSYRQRLIDRRLIEPDGQGYARFLLPHVKDYYFGDVSKVERKDPNQQWNRRR
ncbi:MAG: ATP-binding protein [Eggerthellaceae bacterium]|nr:ATP-binding protein [Eggerthellaceae bacterium]